MSRTRTTGTSRTETRELAGIPVTLVRGGVKNYNLRVRQDGSVRVSMPARGSIAVAERLVAQHREWILARRAGVVEAGEREADPIDPKADAAVLQDVLPEIFARYEAQIGVHCERWRLRHMVSRWGSCNVRTKVITINTELARMPRSCLESVVVHELCHLLEPSHNAHFHALMDQHFPTWRESRAYLNAHPPRRK